MAFDEDGRLWVVEMIDYPYDEREGVPPEGRIRVLEDDDGDGRFERSFVFADQLRWPTGLCLWDGGVFVASAPDILYLKDTDGDRKADHKEVVFTGFRRNNVQALLSNLRWGLDNWFTGSSGQDGGQVRSLRKPDQPAVSVEGRHFRFRPTGEIEALSGDGRYSNTSDDFGRRFCSATTSPVRHVVVEDRYLRRNPHLPGERGRARRRRRRFRGSGLSRQRSGAVARAGHGLLHVGAGRERHRLDRARRRRDRLFHRRARVR